MTPGLEWRVDSDGGAVSVALDASGAPTGDLFVFAHGAGGNMNDQGVLAASARLRERGIDVLRFNFAYSENRSRRPDPMPKLTACIACVVASARERLSPQRVIIGGRSMGGRAASILAADGFRCDGLLLLAYPLHPAGKPQQLRDSHLARIRVPVLCLNGTRDPLCTRELMDGVVSKLASNWRMHWLDGADHSFHVTKAGGRTVGEVQDEIARAVDAWRATLE